MNDQNYYIYILTNRTHTSLYIGMTGHLRRRLEEHRVGASSFTDRYSTRKLVYFEVHNDVNLARQRERTMKHWLRAWKEDLISQMNPEWKDLAIEVPFD